jgi:nucleoside-diphosphate-sugar epimerase
LNATDFEKELYQPALNGTVSVLEAVKKYNPSVKRIVITSSFASNVDVTKGLRPGYVYTESDWNPMTKEEAQAAGPVAAYLVSKEIAERAAFDFVEREKPNFSVATLTPPMVYGPIAHEVDKLESLNTSSADFYRLFNGTSKEVPDTEFWAYVDVRDRKSKQHRTATSTLTNIPSGKGSPLGLYHRCSGQSALSDFWCIIQLSDLHRHYP